MEKENLPRDPGKISDTLSDAPVTSLGKSFRRRLVTPKIVTGRPARLVTSRACHGTPPASRDAGVGVP
eukprot:4557573-Prymnesium_polylepis.1